MKTRGISSQGLGRIASIIKVSQEDDQEDNNIEYMSFEDFGDILNENNIIFSYDDEDGGKYTIYKDGIEIDAMVTNEDELARVFVRRSDGNTIRGLVEIGREDEWIEYINKAAPKNSEPKSKKTKKTKQVDNDSQLFEKVKEGLVADIEQTMHVGGYFETIRYLEDEGFDVDVAGGYADDIMNKVMNYIKKMKK